MKNLLRTGLFATCIIAMGTLASCKDKEEPETENMETEMTTTETMTTAEDTMAVDTMSQSNSPGTTGGSMEQTP